MAVAGRAEIETWLRVRGPFGASGVPPWLARVGRLLAVSLAPWSDWWLSRCRSECAGRGQVGWKPKWEPSRREADRLGQGWAESRQSRAAPSLRGRGAQEAETVPCQSFPPAPSPNTLEPGLLWEVGGQGS